MELVYHSRYQSAHSIFFNLFHPNKSNFCSSINHSLTQSFLLLNVLFLEECFANHRKEKSQEMKIEIWIKIWMSKFWLFCTMSRSWNFTLSQTSSVLSSVKINCLDHFVHLSFDIEQFCYSHRADFSERIWNQIAQSMLNLRNEMCALSKYGKENSIRNFFIRSNLQNPI